MAKIRIIKKRIKSATNIAQITKAMQMVAASRMRKAQEQAVRDKPYQNKIVEAVRELASRVDPSLHPLLRTGNLEGKELVILISTNKGLCGGLNNNLFRFLLKRFEDKKNLLLVTLGKKGEGFVIKSGFGLVFDFSNNNYLDSVSALANLFVKGFLDGIYKGVTVVFNRFISALKQEPTSIQILPIRLEEKLELIEEKANISFSEFLIEPSVDAVLSALLPHYLEIQVRNAILEAFASEHSARMIAMKNATDNAKSLISDLTVTFNRLRQEKITYEIADMVTAQMSI